MTAAPHVSFISTVSSSAKARNSTIFSLTMVHEEIIFFLLIICMPYPPSLSHFLQTVAKVRQRPFWLHNGRPGPIIQQTAHDRRQECSTVIGKDDNGGIMTLKCSPWNGQGPSFISCQLSDIGRHDRTAGLCIHLKGTALFELIICTEHPATTVIVKFSIYLDNFSDCMVSVDENEWKDAVIKRE